MRTFFELILVLVVLALAGCSYSLFQKQKTAETEPTALDFTVENMDSLKALARKLGRTPVEDASVTSVISDLRIALNDTRPTPGILRPEE